MADVLVNRRVVIMTFREKLAAFDACNLEPRFTVTTCYPSPGVHINPIALGERWLAYADQQFVAIHRFVFFFKCKYLWEGAHLKKIFFFF